jgi:cob(I)alamin adenosyltransferase
MALRIYTRTGDQGETGLFGGRRVGKDDPRIACYGTVDELNAAIAVARLHTRTAALLPLDAILERVQHELFSLGSLLATPADRLRPGQPVITDEHVRRLEQEIDAHDAVLPELTGFILPGGGPAAAHLHLCRTVCRRAERLLVTLMHGETVRPEALRYLNRLSDALFVFARWAAHATGEPELPWVPEPPVP